MEHVLGVFKKENIKAGELEEIWGEEGKQRLNELLEDNKEKYEILKNNEIIKKISLLTNSDSAKSIYLTFIEYLKLTEIKEGLKYENVVLSNDLKLEKGKRLEYENKLKENDLISEKNIIDFVKMKKERVLAYYYKNKKKSLTRY